jgi:redox-sensitive bicupin YhaK (pirin superfamily)
MASVYVHGEDKISMHSAGNVSGGTAQEYVAMSFFPAKDPAPGDARAADAIDLVIVPRSVDVGHFAVRRALPHAKRRMVGPFIFFDHFGPAEFHTGQGIDVRPHPHIGLATVTFLFDGEIMHRDSLGTAAAIRPGEVNWMSAGRGIVHSERTAPDHRRDGEPIHGLQCWVALPAAEEESAPAFFHHDSAALPLVSDADKTARIIVGKAYGERSPVATLCDTLFVDVTLTAGATLPIDAETEERAIYVISGEVDIAGDRFAAGRLLVFRPGDALAVTAVGDTRLVLLGGAAMDGPRHIWWNFVSSRKERIEQAKADWKLARFDIVPGDDKEFIPLPD